MLLCVLELPSASTFPNSLFIDMGNALKQEGVNNIYMDGTYALFFLISC